MINKSDWNGNDRRASARIPLSREIRYRSLARGGSRISGAGRTLNMSSSGLFITTEGVVAQGQRLEVVISWPAQGDARRLVELVVKGPVVRSGQGTAAVEIMQYQFQARTQRAGKPAPPPGKQSIPL